MDAVLNVLSYFLWVALALGILVFIHELGHFLAARLFGMRVDQFSIGFPPVLYRKRIGQTEWRLGAVPLGGYVKIAGMVDETLDTEFAGQEPQPDEFRAKPVWQRIVVITAGVVFNLALAFVIFIGLALAYGDPYVPAENVRGVYVERGSLADGMGLETGDRIVEVNGRPLERFDDVAAPRNLAADPLRFTVERGGEQVELEGPDRLLSRLSQTGEASPLAAFGISYEPTLLGGVVTGSPAEEAGLRPGDRIVAVDGRPVRFWEELTGAVRAAGGAPVALRWTRADSLARPADPVPVTLGEGVRVYEAAVTPRPGPEGQPLLGVSNDLRAVGVRIERYGLGEGIVEGSRDAAQHTAFYAHMMGRLFTGKEDLRESVGGPLLIAKQTKEAADQGMGSFWFIVAMLSIALAVFNILPIPVLDGGHLMFLLYEGVTRREPSVKVRIAVQQAGMVLLLAFMAFVLFNDATRWFG